MRCKSIYWLVIMCVIAVSCNESDDGSYAEPITLYEKIDGEWNLMNLKMVDEVAKAAGIEPSEQNLSTSFNYENFKIKFNTDENNRPTTYEVLGDVPPLFAPAGYWGLSADFQQTDGAATRIYLYSDAQKTQQTDELRLTSVPGSSGEMEIQLVRTSNGVAFVSYVFKLSATN